MKELIKDAIANSFVELADEKPFRQITITDIIRKCGISKQTFYNYFRDKYDLMNYVYLTGVEAVIDQVGGYHADMQKAGQGAGELCRGKGKYFITISKLDEQNSFSEYYYRHTYDYYVPESKRVNLPTNSTHFAFRFAALNYQLQHRVHYQYQLEGYDKDWINAGKDRMASYHDVPAGTYKFRVKAFLLESPDAYDLRTIEVYVPPFFIFSSVAVWIYMVVLVVALLFGLWWYQKKLRKRYAPQRAEAADTPETEEKQAGKAENVEKSEEVTDEYEIIES